MPSVSFATVRVCVCVRVGARACILISLCPTQLIATLDFAESFWQVLALAVDSLAARSSLTILF